MQISDVHCCWWSAFWSNSAHLQGMMDRLPWLESLLLWHMRSTAVALSRVSSKVAMMAFKWSFEFCDFQSPDAPFIWSKSPCICTKGVWRMPLMTAAKKLSMLIHCMAKCQQHLLLLQWEFIWFWSCPGWTTWVTEIDSNYTEYEWSTILSKELVCVLYPLSFHHIHCFEHAFVARTRCTGVRFVNVNKASEFRNDLNKVILFSRAFLGRSLKFLDYSWTR